MDLWAAFDESQRLFSQRKEQSGTNGNAIIDHAGTIRGTGMGFSASVLTTDDLSSTLPNLTSSRVIGRCGSINEYSAAGNFIGLSPEQVLWFMHHAKPGLFIGQASEGSWRYPFLFKVPLFDRSKILPPTDQEADATIEDMDAGRIVPADKPAEAVTISDEMPSQSKETDTLTLTSVELKILKAIVENPMRFASDYIKLAKVSPNTMSKVRPKLIADGFIAEHISESNGRGRSACRLEPLEKARQIISTSNEEQK
jgi:DNA-binding MarR family transcriptional regulator